MLTLAVNVLAAGADAPVHAGWVSKLRERASALLASSAAFRMAVYQACVRPRDSIKLRTPEAEDSSTLRSSDCTMA